MKKDNPNVINGEYKLSEWVRLYNEGAFNHPSKAIMIDAGFFDWFCEDKSLYGRFKKLAPKVVDISKSQRINPEKTYVFFKNNCPLTGPLYDSFSICDIDSGNVLYWFGNIKKGCYGEDISGWEVDTMIDGKVEVLFEAARWNKVKKYFQI